MAKTYTLTVRPSSDRVRNLHGDVVTFTGTLEELVRELERMQGDNETVEFCREIRKCDYEEEGVTVANEKVYRLFNMNKDSICLAPVKPTPYLVRKFARAVLGDWIHEAKHWEHLITLEEN